MRTFLDIKNGESRLCYITKITKTDVYYGYFKEGCENKKADGVRPLESFKQLCKNEIKGTCYIGCTHGRSEPYTHKIVYGGAI